MRVHSGEQKFDRIAVLISAVLMLVPGTLFATLAWVAQQVGNCCWGLISKCQGLRRGS